MASLIDMSLDDIIKKKRINTGPKRRNKPNKQSPPQKLRVTDARNKIISKKRVQITDAREKLAELAKHKDARLKLEQLRTQRMTRNQAPGRNAFPQSRGKFTRIVPNKERDPSRQVVSQPLSTTKLRRQVNTKRFMENRSVATRNSAKMPRPKPILRTVDNDLEIIDEPMEEDYSPPKPNLLNRKASLQLKIITHNNDARESRSSTVHRTAIVEKDMSPPRPPSILKKRPMASLRTEKKVQNSEKPVLEYRIIVSNLRNTVTGGDIEELFGDVGGMVESRLVRPGTAEVIYKSQEDAQRAVDLYHNRQLDGQPMNCLLVTPRSHTAPPRSSSSKPALFSTNSNVEPDISTFHKVLFSNL